ncbi:MAG: ParB/RepB/Spo0J family partition protein [Bacteroidales bacterium]|nr:ParB/RepB/Spo0J family partition protein [Bacteroidales bacterium]MDE7101992.1 ParB/RepB/Spo0J family partition protein [Bacteroidales bacterium]
MTSKRPALGRGLSALMGEIPVKKDAESRTPVDMTDSVIGAIAAIPVELIEANPYQPRKQFSKESLEELSQSIRTNGVISPITVRKIGKKYQLISGERRLRASKLAGLKEIPAYIRMATDNESLEMALIENIQREDLNAIDVALSYQALIDACHYNQEQLAERVGKGRSTVANFLRLLKLPADIQLYLKDNKLSMGHARCLAGVTDEEKQLRLARNILENGLSVRQLEDLIRQTDTPEKTDAKPAKTGKTPTQDAELPDWCVAARNRLAERLNTPIAVKPKKNGKGSLIIDYASDEVLQKIFDALNGK